MSERRRHTIRTAASEIDPTIPMSTPIVRVGLPQRGGALVRAARNARYPVLFSANAFAQVYPAGHRYCGGFMKFARPLLDQLDGLDAALDSSGFVAAVRYGDYRWRVEDYYELVSAYPWTWAAAMDYCCEPEIANDRPLRLLRIAATAYNYGHCAREAKRRGCSPPLPVIQGWLPREYVECADQMPLLEWPSLIGIGSVCRRHLTGEAGLLTIIDALDNVLPDHVRFHLFGVKSTALTALAGHPRIASVDSMAWDAQARRQRPTGRDAEFRASCMHAWAAKQKHAAEFTQPISRQTVLFDPDEFSPGFTSKYELILEALALEYAELILTGDVTYKDAVWLAKMDAYQIEAIVPKRTPRSLLKELEDILAGLGDRVERMLTRSCRIAFGSGLR